MRRRGCLVGGLLAIAGGSTLAQWSPNMPRMALVVGNGAYKVAPLQSTLNDVNLMADALQSVGFAVERFTDLTDRQFQSAVEAFARKAGRAGVLSLVYLAGHGSTVRGSMRFLGLSAEPVRSEDDVERHSTDLAWVLKTMATQRSVGPAPRAPILLVADMDTTEDFLAPGTPPTHPAILRKTLEQESGTLVMLPNVFGRSSLETEDGKNGILTKQLVASLSFEGATLNQIANRTLVMAHRESTQRLSPQIVRSNVNADEIVFKPRQDDPKVRGRSARGG
ncbi:MAG: caspase family protein [Burkholderiales bacterium]|nr:MAG: caspase family protein [Burkholderiales bacterium]